MKLTDILKPHFNPSFFFTDIFQFIGFNMFLFSLLVQINV